GLFSRAEVRLFLGIARRRILLDHEEGLTAARELAQKRHECADADNLVAGAHLSRIERVAAEAQLGLWMRTSPPAGIGECVHHRNADSAANAVIAERFLGQVERRAAA